MEQPIDRQQLTNRCLGNLELVEEVLNVFESSFAADIYELESKLQSPPAMDEATILAHRMKGSAANAGAVKLTKIAATIEVAARLGVADAAAQGFLELRHEWKAFQFVRSQDAAGSQP